jgi:hypothetical protein
MSGYSLFIKILCACLRHIRDVPATGYLELSGTFHGQNDNNKLIQVSHIQPHSSLTVFHSQVFTTFADDKSVLNFNKCSES